MKVEVVSSNPLAFKLVGSITEGMKAALEEVSSKVGPETRSVNFELSGVDAINSIGIAMWIEFLKNIPISTSIGFAKCPPVFIDYLNMVPSVVHHGKVASVLVPYDCSHCGHAWTNEVDLSGEIGEFAAHDCEKCQTSTEAGEEAEEYLSFLEE